MQFLPLARRLPVSARPLLQQRTIRTSSVASTSTLPPAPPTPSEPAAVEEPEAGLLPYLVTRTASGFLPVYGEIKSDGQRFLTVVRKIDGDVHVRCAACYEY